MAFVSVTRLRPRGPHLLPFVAFHTWRSADQVKRAAGFLGGYLASGPRLTLWTVTVWTDEDAMRGYRNAAPHLRAMPGLMRWCDEAAVVHWITDDVAPPSPDEAARAMGQGRTSRLKRPSAAHAAGEPWPDRKAPRRGVSLSP